MRLHFMLVALVPALVTAAPSQLGSKTKTVSPCGVKILPLAVGNQWTYSQLAWEPPADSQIARLAPIAPNTVVVTVKAITSGPSGDTVVTLEETMKTELAEKPSDERTITTTITCNTTKFDLSPDSFWFSGEPGGSLGFKLGSLSRPKGTSFQLTGGRFGDAEWREDLVALWTRVPYAGSEAAAGSGKLELERRFTPQQAETVKTKVGSYTAEKLALITTGRVALDASPERGARNQNDPGRNGKPTELPAGWVSTLWVAEGVGVVQTLNPVGRMYQLSAITLK